MKPAASRSRSQGPPPGAIPADKFINSFSGLVANMASAATNHKAVLEQLVATTITHYTEIKALLQESKYQRISNNSGSNPNTNHTPDGDDMGKLKTRNVTLQNDIMKGWTKGGLCSTHGHGVIAVHDSHN